MSACVAIGNRDVLPYGSSELKRVYRKNLTIALSISVVLHLLVVWGVMVLAGAPEQWDGGRLPYRPPEREVPVDLLPFVPGIIEPPGRTEHSGVKPDAGIPTPVRDADPERTIADQHQLRERVAPPADADGWDAGTGTRGLEISPEVELPPEPWVPVEKHPVVVRRVEPVYPPLAVKAGIEGKVWVKMWVDREGKVREAHIERTSHDIFNDVSLEAARQFLFTPAYMNHGPVSVWVTVPFTYRLAPR